MCLVVKSAAFFCEMDILNLGCKNSYNEISQKILKFFKFNRHHCIDDTWVNQYKLFNSEVSFYDLLSHNIHEWFP